MSVQSLAIPAAVQIALQVVSSVTVLSVATPVPKVVETNSVVPHNILATLELASFVTLNETANLKAE